MDSDDFGQVIDTYRILAEFCKTKWNPDLNISLHNHKSIADLRDHLESAVDIALAVICNESSCLIRNEDDLLKSACSELARVIDRLGQ